MSAAINFLVWLLLILIAGFVIQYLWNNVLSKAVNFVAPITLWQTFGLIILFALFHWVAYGPNQNYFYMMEPKQLRAATRSPMRRR